MNLAIFGAGRVGSTFALHLARGGHDVTLIARGARLEALNRDGAIIAVNGDRAPVKAVATLDPAVPFDLVLVTVLAHQVDAILPELIASAATSVLFLFNSFEGTERLRAAVGAARASFGFPTMAAFFVDGRLKSSVTAPGMKTTLDSEPWAAVLAKAGLPTAVEQDMDSFLRSHAAFVAPLMAAGCLVHARGANLTWAEARQYTAAVVEALEVVRGLGHRLIPSMVAGLVRVPRVVLCVVIWLFTRTSGVRDLGQFGPTEARQLIDAMTRAAPGRTQKLLAIRP